MIKDSISLYIWTQLWEVVGEGWRGRLVQFLVIRLSGVVQRVLATNAGDQEALVVASVSQEEQEDDRYDDQQDYNHQDYCNCNDNSASGVLEETLGIGRGGGGTGFYRMGKDNYLGTNENSTSEIWLSSCHDHNVHLRNLLKYYIKR